MYSCFARVNPDRLLVKAFGQMISNEPGLFIRDQPEYLLLKPHYLHELFSSLASLWTQKKVLDWDQLWTNILGFADALVCMDSFWQTPVGSPGDSFIGNTDCVIGDVARLIESGCGADEHPFGVGNIPAAKAVLENILCRQRGEKYAEDSDAFSIATDSPKGKCLEAYIHLALYECRVSPDHKADSSVNWDSYEPVFSDELGKADLEDQPEYEFATLVANYLPNFFYLSETWVMDHLSKIFDRSNHLRWLCAIQGYSSVGRFDLRIYNDLKEDGHFLAVMDSAELKDSARDRYIRFLCVGYLHRHETLGEEGSVIAAILDRNILDEIAQVIWVLWTLRESDYKRLVEVTGELWPILLGRIDVSTEEGRKLASCLCQWAVFIPELNERTMGWLSKIAPYGSTFLLEPLAQLSDRQPFEAYEIWKGMLENYGYDHHDDPIKQIFANLSSRGKKGIRAAKVIADLTTVRLKLRQSGIFSMATMSYSKIRVSPT